MNDGIPKHEELLLKTTRDEAIEIIQFLVSYHIIRKKEIDFKE